MTAVRQLVDTTQQADSALKELGALRTDKELKSLAAEVSLSFMLVI